MKWRLLAAPLLLAFAIGARADEIRLKDGSKIVGTIVDFEDGSFKIETAYGFAMVRKDSIAEIITSTSEQKKPAAGPASPAKPVETSPAPAAAAASPAPATRPAKPESQPAVARMPAPAATPAAVVTPTPPRAAEPAPKPAAAPAPVTPTAAAVTPTLPRAAEPAPKPAAAPGPVAATAPVAAAPPPVAPPAAPPGPPLIQEVVEGNVYINQTYGFKMFRPPSWQLLPDARKALPNAITALGTSDETTLVVVGREPLKDSLDAHSANAERALRKIYENYRPVSTTRRTVADLPAIERRFRGVVDGHDYSVAMVTLVRGTDVFTLLGMTYADSDLIQIRENVISKMISSLDFTPAR